jgi:hypothetical protein
MGKKIGDQQNIFEEIFPKCLGESVKADDQNKLSDIN